jgi:MFS family permease
VAEFAPILALALVDGALADAFDRRRLVAVAEGGAALVAGVLVVNALLADPHLSVLYAGAALMAAFMALRRPPLDALVPQLVERDELKAAAAIDFLAGTSGWSPARRWPAS